MFWIDHPATQDEPVSIWRWAKYHVADWLGSLARRWEFEALHGRRWRNDDLPF